jgi:hypothetical protein
MVDLTDSDLDLVVFNFDEGYVFFPGTVGSIGSQLLHWFSAAMRDAGMFLNHGNHVAALGTTI